MSDARDKKSICAECSNEVSACRCKISIQCFAWIENDERFGLDIDSISETEDRLRTKLLMQSMGWRYDHGGHDKEWKRLLTFGRIVTVVVSLTPSPKKQTEAMIADLREAGGSDLDNVVKASECITNLGHVMSNQTGECLGCGIDLSSASACPNEDSEKSVFDLDAMSHDKRIQFLLNAIKAQLIFGLPEEKIRDIVEDLEVEIFKGKELERSAGKE